MRLKDKVAIVTGAAKGLGREFATGMAKEGAKIMAVTRKDLANLEKTVKEIQSFGGVAKSLQADVAIENDTKRIAEETFKTFGKIDILVNCAAVYDGLVRKSFTEIDPNEWDLVISVNVKGPCLCTRAVFPYMKQQGKGKIVNLSSEVSSRDPMVLSTTSFKRRILSKVKFWIRPSRCWWILARCGVSPAKCLTRWSNSWPVSGMGRSRS